MSTANQDTPEPDVPGSSRTKKTASSGRPSSESENLLRRPGVKPEQAGLLWRILNKETRRNVARHLDSGELEDLNRNYNSYKKLRPEDRKFIEDTLRRETARSLSPFPFMLFGFMSLCFIALFFLHVQKYPALSIMSSAVIFTPLFLGVFAPLSLYLLPQYRLRILFRPALSPESLVVSFVSFLGLLFCLVFIGLENRALSPVKGAWTPAGFSFFIYCLGAITAPLLEEVFFREVIPSLFGAPPHYVGHMVGATLFALAHIPGSTSMFLYYLVAALFLAVVRQQTGGLLYPLLVHSLANLTNLLFFPA